MIGHKGSFGLCCDRCGLRGCAGGCGGTETYGSIGTPTGHAFSGEMMVITGTTAPYQRARPSPWGGLFGPASRPQNHYAPTDVPEWTYPSRYGSLPRRRGRSYGASEGTLGSRLGSSPVTVSFGVRGALLLAAVAMIVIGTRGRA